MKTELTKLINQLQHKQTNMQHPPQNNMPVPGGPGGPPQQANGAGGPAGHDDSYFTEVSLHFLNISYVIFIYLVQPFCFIGM